MNKKTIKNQVAKLASKSLKHFADHFAGVLCCGSLYEPKMPEKLKK